MNKEVLEALETIKNATTKGSGWIDVEIKYEYPREIKIIEQALKEVENLKKVNLELNKLVDILSKENTLISMMVQDDK